MCLIKAELRRWLSIGEPGDLLSELLAGSPFALSRCAADAAAWATE